jgi:signal transduction histidine kinase
MSLERLMSCTCKSSTDPDILASFVHATLAGTPFEAPDSDWELIGRAICEINELNVSSASATIDSLPEAGSDLQSFAIEILKLRIANNLREVVIADSCIGRLQAHPLTNDPLARAVRDFMVGIAFTLKSEYDVALNHLLNAACSFHSLGWHYENAVCEHQIGHVLLILGDHSHAIKKFLSITEIFRNHGPKKNYAILTANLAQALLRSGEYLEAEERYISALDSAPFADPGIPRAEVLLNIALINKTTGQDVKAAQYYRQALAIAEAQGTVALRAHILAALAELEMIRGDLATAEQLVGTVATIPQSQLYVSTRLQIAGTQAFLFHEAGNHDAAVRAVREAIDLGQTHRLFEHTSMLISDVLTRTKDDGFRLELLQVYVRVQDQRLEAVSKSTSLIIEMHARFQAERTRIEMELRREHSQVMLDSQTAMMNEIGREIHDSLGQNLAVLLRLSERMVHDLDRVPTDLAPVVTTLHNVCSRVVNDARRISHQLVEESSFHSHIEQALEELGDELRRALPEMELQIIINGSFSDISQSCARALYRAAQNLLQNVIQHSEAAHCSLNIVAHDDQYHLSVEDNGRGFDPMAIRGGTGLRELRARIDLLGGDVSIDSHPGHGSYVDVRLPRSAKDGIRITEHARALTSGLVAGY